MQLCNGYPCNCNCIFSMKLSLLEKYNGVAEYHHISNENTLKCNINI